MDAAVIIPTYNNPRGLELCLTGLARQEVMPGEIAVADDGSTEETRKLIESWRSRLGCPLVHAWHEDQGFRKGEICNKAVQKTESTELLFIDGDSIPHSKWVADHLDAASRGQVRCGRRVKLGPKITGLVDPELVAKGRLQSLMGPVVRGAFMGDTKRLTLGIRLPYLVARLFHPRPRKLMGVNFSLSRAAFEEVNGYDHEWEAPFREDRDLDLRLNRAGFRYIPLLNRAIVYHLYHGERPPVEEFEARVLEEATSNRIRCRQGLTSDH